jgi:hypothetical protein
MLEDTVVISGKCFKLFKNVLADFDDGVQTMLEEYGFEHTITSANDGGHSKNSTHYQNKAIDVKIDNIDLGRQWREKVLESIIMYLADQYKDFLFIIHLYDGKNHLHIQHGTDNIISFDNAIGENKNVFIK